MEEEPAVMTRKAYISRDRLVRGIVSALLLSLFLPFSIGAEELKFDLVVIGAGGTGLAAAVTAAEQGAKVLVLEKQPYAGGTSNYFEGIFAAESAMQRAQYIGYSRDEAFKKIMDYNHWRANPRLVRTVVDESAVTIEWLQEHGVEFPEVTINFPDGTRTYHMVKGRGAALVKTLVKRAEEKGVLFFYSTAATRLLKNGGRIVGVVAERNGKPIEIRSRAVIVATGGYANNKEWIKKYSGLDLGGNIVPFGNVGKMGDGIRMAREAGAAEEGMGVLELNRIGPLGPEIAIRGSLQCAAAQADLWVTQRGERICDEGIAFLETFVGNAVARVKEGFTYNIIDDSIKEHLAAVGIERNLASDRPPGTRLRDFDREVQEAINKGSKEVFAADSIEKLAMVMGADPAVLKATVEEYNRFCETGHDALFGKDRKYLLPIKGPRFYALKAYTVTIGTLGGIKINEKMEAVDKDNRPVPGLYAGGFDAGGLYGDSYSFKYSSGMSACFAVTSGRVAARNALKYIGR